MVLRRMYLGFVLAGARCICSHQHKSYDDPPDLPVFTESGTNTVFTLRPLRVRYGTVPVETVPDTRSHRMEQRLVPATFDPAQCGAFIKNVVSYEKAVGFSSSTSESGNRKTAERSQVEAFMTCSRHKASFTSSSKQANCETVTSMYDRLSLSLLSTQIIRSVWTIPRYLNKHYYCYKMCYYHATLFT